MNTIEQLIIDLDLQPHPEGGYFKETYRSVGKIDQDSLGVDYVGNRNYSTCIYFLLTSDTFSAFHKINQDEIWHFYDGSPLVIHMISDTGKYSNVTVGGDFSKGEKLQFIVPGQHWFAAKVVNDNDYSLVGCTVSPGFDFKDFILPKRQELVSKFPQHQNLIKELTHE